MKLAELIRGAPVRGVATVTVATPATVSQPPKAVATATPATVATIGRSVATVATVTVANPETGKTRLGDVRARLADVAERLGVDRGLVDRMPDAEVMLWAAVPADALPAFLLGARDIATRQAGKVPLDDTAPAMCAQCGPVYLQPDVAAVLPVVNGWPRALGCPWCFIRKAGGYVPRPPVACATCTSFQPDPLNPGVGMGTCACGMHHAQERHACATYRPNNEVRP